MSSQNTIPGRIQFKDLKITVVELHEQLNHRSVLSYRSKSKKGIRSRSPDSDDIWFSIPLTMAESRRLY
jgi:hypothetical protein